MTSIRTRAPTLAMVAPSSGVAERTMLPPRSAAAALAVLTSAAAEGPCDILGAADNQCVAAHSTVRALYANYSGPLYKLSRTDGHSANVDALEPGGFANITTTETFCTKGDCVIAKVSPMSLRRPCSYRTRPAARSTHTLCSQAPKLPSSQAPKLPSLAVP